jgi:hypothetical protein
LARSPGRRNSRPTRSSSSTLSSAPVRSALPIGVPGCCSDTDDG